MCLLNRLVTIIPLCFCLEKEGLTDKLRRREGGRERANHLCVCRVKEVQTCSMRRTEIRAGGRIREKEVIGEGMKKEIKLGGRRANRSWEGKGRISCFYPGRCD